MLSHQDLSYYSLTYVVVFLVASFFLDLPPITDIYSSPLHSCYMPWHLNFFRLTFLIIFYIILYLPTFCNIIFGRAVGQAVSRLLLTAAARVPAQFKLSGISGGQSGTTIGQRVANMTSGLSLTRRLEEKHRTRKDGLEFERSDRRKTLGVKFKACTGNRKKTRWYIYVQTDKICLEIILGFTQTKSQLRT
jgi:hypothetical protein